MSMIVTEDVKIILNGEPYLLERGDKIIVVEALEHNIQKMILKRAGIDAIYGPDDFWRSKDKVEKHLKIQMGKMNRKMKSMTPESTQFRRINSLKNDVKQFMNDGLDEVLLSVAASDDVREAINQDKIERQKNVDTAKDVEQTIASTKSTKDEELRKAFGQTPEEYIKHKRDVGRNIFSEDYVHIFRSIIKLL